MDFSARTRKAPRMGQDRIILHFDYDCFYAQVVENSQPALRSLPLGIKQKSILATCNYVARSRGVRKLQLISDAKKVCPDLVLADGEDLSAFRDVSKRLYALLRSYSWNNKVERLGLDEIFLDVTDIIAYNVGLLNVDALPGSFFCLAPDDPEKGFSFDASAVAGCVVGAAAGAGSYENPLFVRLLLASHLARHLRLRIEEEGYTSACGISTSKLLSKLAGAVNKPRNQTTLLSLHQEDVLRFVDAHALRRVPGIGGKMTHALESFFLGRDAGAEARTDGPAVAVGAFRGHPAVSPQMLERLLGRRPGSERGIGDKAWALVHGVDDTEVKTASSVPTQISIEDTYPGPAGGLHTAAEVERELLKLAASLLRRMHADLAEDEGLDNKKKTTTMPTSLSPASGVSGSVGTAPPARRRWLARPRTLRLSTRPRTSHSDGRPYNWGRSSRSQPLPTFVFTGSSSGADDEAIAARLVRESLLPMFSALNPAKDGWNIGMINICVANMVPTAAEPGAAGSGRDISQMFRRQEDVLRNFRVHLDDDDDNKEEEEEERGVKLDITEGTSRGGPDMPAHLAASEQDADAYDVDMAEGETGAWHELDGSQACGRCGHFIPPFARAAHERYHELGDG